MSKRPAPIDPWFSGAAPAGQMLWLADAYAEAAKVLCDHLVADNFARQYTSTRVVLYLCRHATELFLKGAIGAKTGNPPTRIHRLDRLYTDYVRLYPHDNHLFEVPFFSHVLIPKDDLFPGTMDEYYETHDQRYRYPMDSKGKPFAEVEAFDVVAYAQAVAEFRQAVNILVARIEFPRHFGDNKF